MTIAAAFGSMIGIGASSITSIKLGEGNRRAAEQTLGNLMILKIIVGLLITAGGLLTLKPLLYFFGASHLTIDYAYDYMQIILMGTIVTHTFLGLNEMLRATGYPQKAMMLVLLTVVINGILNAIFIFGLDWGIRGAAIATVIAQCIALSFSLSHFNSKSSYIRFRRTALRLRTKIIKGILSIGVAPLLFNICASIVVIFVNKALKSSGGEDGDIYIGAFGVINRVALLFVMMVSGLNQGMQPIVGYNFGNKRYDRVIKALKYTIMIAIGITTMGFLIVQLAPDLITSAFVNQDVDPDTPPEVALRLVELSKQGLRIALMMFPLVGMQIVTSGFFLYIGKAQKSIILSLSRQMFFLLPLLMILPPRLGPTGVWYAITISDSAAIIITAVMLILEIRKMRKRQREFEYLQ